MNTELIIKNIMKKHRFKDETKLIEHMRSKAKYDEISDAQIVKIFRKYNKRRAVKTYNKLLMGNKFSAVPDAWQIDIFKIGNISNWLLCININTKYAWTHQVPGKTGRGKTSAAEILPAMIKFIQEMKPKVIEGDEEFNAKEYINLFQTNDIAVKITPKKYHAYLSVINKLCKTLNDMIYFKDNKDKTEVSEGSNEENSDFKIVEASEDYGDAVTSARSYEAEEHTAEDSQDVVESDLYKLVDKYNRTYNHSIKTTPIEMQTDVNKQYKWIYEQFETRDKKEKLLLKNPIVVGDVVRYILDEDRNASKFAKHQRRRQLSKYYYRVVRKLSPYLYEIAGKDGLTKPIPRYRLYKIDNKFGKKFAPSVNSELAKDSKHGELFYYKIYDVVYPKRTEWNTDTVKYVVKTAYLDKKEHLIILPEKQQVSVYTFRVRMKRPATLSNLELEFLKNNSDKYKFDKKLGLLIPI